MIDDYDALIGLIYDGVMDDAPWSQALAQVADRIGAAGAGLGMQDMQTHEFRSLGAAGISAELNPTYRRLAPDNRIWREIGRRREPLTDRMVMPKDALVRTELYAHWFRPQNFHSVMAYPALFKDNASAVVVAFRSRAAGDFEAEDLARLGRFAGHFGRALGARMDREQTFERLAAANFMLDEVRDAILLIDREARRSMRTRPRERCSTLAIPYGFVGAGSSSQTLRPMQDSCIWRLCAATARFASRAETR
jgi:hypothetical protein